MIVYFVRPLIPCYVLIPWDLHPTAWRTQVIGNYLCVCLLFALIDLFTFCKFSFIQFQYLKSTMRHQTKWLKETIFSLCKLSVSYCLHKFNSFGPTYNFPYYLDSKVALWIFHSNNRAVWKPKRFVTQDNDHQLMSIAFDWLFPFGAMEWGWRAVFCSKLYMEEFSWTWRSLKVVSPVPEEELTKTICILWQSTH